MLLELSQVSGLKIVSFEVKPDVKIVLESKFDATQSSEADFIIVQPQMLQTIQPSLAAKMQLNASRI